MAAVETSTAQPQQTATLSDTEIMHPLQHTWVLWFDKSMKSRKSAKQDQHEWESNLKAVGSIDTVEKFWQYQENIPEPQELEDEANYHFFKDGIKPTWEDPVNAKGGKWTFFVEKKADADTNRLWETLLLVLIGEQLPAEFSEDITGVVFSRRTKNGNRISIWNKSYEEGFVRRLGQTIADKIDAPRSLRCEYIVHSDSMRTGASFRGARIKLEL